MFQAHSSSQERRSCAGASDREPAGESVPALLRYQCMQGSTPIQEPAAERQPDTHHQYAGHTP